MFFALFPERVVGRDGDDDGPEVAQCAFGGHQHRRVGEGVGQLCQRVSGARRDDKAIKALLLPRRLGLHDARDRFVARELLEPPSEVFRRAETGLVVTAACDSTGTTDAPSSTQPGPGAAPLHSCSAIRTLPIRSTFLSAASLLAPLASSLMRYMGCAARYIRALMRSSRMSPGITLAKISPAVSGATFPGRPRSRKALMPSSSAARNRCRPALGRCR